MVRLGEIFYLYNVKISMLNIILYSLLWLGICHQVSTGKPPLVSWELNVGCSSESCRAYQALDYYYSRRMLWNIWARRSNVYTVLSFFITFDFQRSREEIQQVLNFIVAKAKGCLSLWCRWSSFSSWLHNVCILTIFINENPKTVIVWFGFGFGFGFGESENYNRIRGWKKQTTRTVKVTQVS